MLKKKEKKILSFSEYNDYTHFTVKPSLYLIVHSLLFLSKCHTFKI